MGPTEQSTIKPFMGTGFGRWRLEVLTRARSKGMLVHFEYDLDDAIKLKREEIVKSMMNPSNFCAVLPSVGSELTALIRARREYLTTPEGTKEFSTVFLKAKTSLEQSADQALGMVQELVDTICKNVIADATGAMEVLQLLQETFLPPGIKTRTDLEETYNNLKFTGTCASYKSALWRLYVIAN